MNGTDVAAGLPVQSPLVNQSRTSPSPSACRGRRSPSPGRAPSSPPAPTSPSHAPRRGSPSRSTTRAPSPRAAHTRPVEPVVGAVTRVGGLEREAPRHVRRLRERRRVRDPGGVQRERAPTSPPGCPAQVPLVNQSNVTVPVGVPRPPVTVAWSCTVVPAGTDVTVACAASWITVDRVGRDRRHRQRLTRRPSNRCRCRHPSSVAWNAKLPDTPGVCVNVVPSATPEASSGNGADVAAAGPVQVPLVNQSNVTVPVGVAEAAGHRRLVVHRRPRRHRRHRRMRRVVDHRHRVRRDRGRPSSGSHSPVEPA